MDFVLLHRSVVNDCSFFLSFSISLYPLIIISQQSSFALCTIEHSLHIHHLDIVHASSYAHFKQDNNKKLTNEEKKIRCCRHEKRRTELIGFWPQERDRKMRTKRNCSMSPLLSVRHRQYRHHHFVYSFT